MLGFVAKLLCLEHGIFRALLLFACNRAEGHEDGQIDSPSIVENAPDDTLDVFDVVFAQAWRCVGGEGVLCFSAILFGSRLVGAILQFRGQRMPLFLELLDDVPGHGYVERTCHNPT